MQDGKKQWKGLRIGQSKKITKIDQEFLATKLKICSIIRLRNIR
ncbi:MAG: hypothetical protein PWQ94_1462 [Thermoanaerobacterium sp.]|nr:hypothetical protein [Thermoanaerobacterium sp.]